MHSFEVHSNESACRKGGSLELEQVLSLNISVNPGCSCFHQDTLLVFDSHLLVGSDSFFSVSILLGRDSCGGTHCLGAFLSHFTNLLLWIIFQVSNFEQLAWIEVYRLVPLYLGDILTQGNLSIIKISLIGLPSQVNQNISPSIFLSNTNTCTIKVPSL